MNHQGAIVQMVLTLDVPDRAIFPTLPTVLRRQALCRPVDLAGSGVEKG